MKKLFLITIILLLQSFPSYGKVGDGYICHPREGIYSFGKDLMISKSESLSDPIHIEKFVWLKDAIQFNELKLTIPITIQTNDSINETPLLDLSIYLHPSIIFCVFFTIFKNFNILKSIKCNHVSIIRT